jgi:hypothetical protein
MVMLGTRAPLAEATVVSEALLCIYERRAGDSENRCRGDDWLEHLILQGCQGDANKITAPRWLKLNFGHLKQKADYSFVMLNKPSSRLHNIATFTFAGGANGFEN